MTPGYLLSAKAAKATADTVRRVLGQRPPVGQMDQSSGNGVGWYWGKLATELTAGAMANPTTCEVDVWLPEVGNTDDPVVFAVAQDEDLLGLTVVNRSDMTGTVGTMVKIEYAFGEWSFKWVDC